MFAKANVNGVARCRDSSSISEVPYHCHMQGKSYKTPATRSTSQKYQSIVTQKIQQKFLHIGKCLGTPMFYTTLCNQTIYIRIKHLGNSIFVKSNIKLFFEFTNGNLSQKFAEYGTFFNHEKELLLSRNFAKRQVKAWGRFSTLI